MCKTWLPLKHRAQTCYVLNSTKLSRKSNSSQLSSNPTTDNGTLKHSINREIYYSDDNHILQVDGDTFILRELKNESTTESFDVKTEAVETGKQMIFEYLKGSKLYSFVEGLCNPPPPPAETKSQNGII